MDILDRLSELKKPVPKSGMTREKAMEIYLSHGGILKIDDSDQGNKKLIYPDKHRLESQLEQAIEKLVYLNTQIKELEERYNSSFDNVFVNVGKLVDPLYWEHLIKMKADKGYKNTCEVVGPPINKLRDKKWRKVAKMFIKDPEYRERLYEAKTSEIGRGRGTMSESIEKTLQSNRDLMAMRIKKLKKERDFYDQKAGVLKSLREFSMESD